MMDQNDSNAKTPTRRDFLKTATATGAAALLASGNYAFAQGSDKIRVGLIGCGGRGTGAAADALQADPGATLIAMGDVVQSSLDRSLRALKEQDGIKEKVQGTPDQ